MKKIFIFSLFTLLFLLITISYVSAHPGNTASDGCHYCRTNCSSWGYTYGTRHCHGGSSYSYPSYSSPSYDYSTPSIPDCPLMSSYNYSTGSCECYAGYVVDTDIFGDQTCVDGDSKCWDDYGYGSQYNSLSKKCECSSGYVWDENILGELECTSCFNKYGLYSSYNYLTDSCECSKGYMLGEGIFRDYECVKEDTSYSSGLTAEDYLALYELLYGDDKTCPVNSYLNGDSCYCNTGYKVNNEKDGCVKILCSANSSLVGSECVCSAGYVMRNNVCISHTEDCKNTYGNNVYGVKGDSNNSSCYCNSGHEWNSGKTACIEEVVVKGIDLVSEEIKIKEFIEEERGKIVLVDENLSNRLKGRILLQVENHGEAWYVNPNDTKRHYMANGKEAYNIMRDLGVGITNADLERVKTDTTFAKKHSGKIFLQVEANGEAYYIDIDGGNHYLKNGEDAYNVMRDLGLGVTNNDLNKIDIDEVE